MPQFNIGDRVQIGVEDNVLTNYLNVAKALGADNYTDEFIPHPNNLTGVIFCIDRFPTGEIAAIKLEDLPGSEVLIRTGDLTLTADQNSRTTTTEHTAPIKFTPLEIYALNDYSLFFGDAPNEPELGELTLLVLEEITTNGMSASYTSKTCSVQIDAINAAELIEALQQKFNL